MSWILSSGLSAKLVIPANVYFLHLIIYYWLFFLKIDCARRSSSQVITGMWQLIAEDKNVYDKK